MTIRDKKPTEPGKHVVHHEGEAIVIDIPMSFRRRSGRKEIVLPPGAAATSTMPAKQPTPLALALARDIAEAALNGEELDDLSLRGLRRDVPRLWQEQREVLGLDKK